MSYNLIRCNCGCIYAEADGHNCNKVSDVYRIEELEEKLLSATMDGYDMAKYEYRDRIEQLVAINEELETKLAKVVAAGVRVRNYYENHESTDVYAVSDFNAVIAELKGL